MGTFASYWPEPPGPRWERVAPASTGPGRSSTKEDEDQVLAGFADIWGSGDPGWVSAIAPSQAANKAFRDQLVIGHLDVRPVLPAISAPTLVLVHRDNVSMPALFGRYLAEHIPDAKLVELAGGDHLDWVGTPMPP